MASPAARQYSGVFSTTGRPQISSARRRSSSSRPAGLDSRRREAQRARVLEERLLILPMPNSSAPVDVGLSATLLKGAARVLDSVGVSSGV